MMREDNDQDQNAAPQSRESDPIKLNVFGKNQSALYQAVSETEMSILRASEGSNTLTLYLLVSSGLKVL